MSAQTQSLFVDQHVDDGPVAAGLPVRVLAREEHEEGHAQAPDVAGRAVLLSHQALGSHELDGAFEGLTG